MRQGELFALRWDDVSGPNMSIHVRRSYSAGVETTPKSNKSRTIAIQPELYRVLRQHRATSNLVFPSRHGGYLTNNQVRRPMQRIARAAGVKRLSFHGMRHTFASQLAIKGVPLNTIRELMGHATIQMTLRYAHLAPATTRDAVAKLYDPVGHTARN